MTTFTQGQLTNEQIAAVLARALCGLTCCPEPGVKYDEVTDGIFEDVNSAVEAAKAAQKLFAPTTVKFRGQLVDAIRTFALTPENLQYMAEQAVVQTGMGNVHDKVLKNRNVAQFTPGVEDLMTEAWSGDDGLSTVEMSPFGVIAAITPTTNPTETIICNTIGMLVAGNTVVFAPHPKARDLSIWLIRELNQLFIKLGAPANLISMVREPSLEATNQLMAHPDIAMVCATGGPGLVKAALASGKKVVGAGAGNPPVVVDATADIARAASCIVTGSSFDHNLPCTCEKEVIAVDSITDLLIFEMIKNGAYQVKDPAELKRLEELIVDSGHGKLEWVGKSAVEIAKAAGIAAPSNTKLLIAETDLMHPFVQIELMMPVLPIVRAKDVDDAIEKAILCEHGLRHTAIMHSSDVNALTRMGRMIQTTIFVKNGPSFAGLGIGGEGFVSFTIAGPTGEGITSARTFARRRRCVLVGGLNIR